MEVLDSHCLHVALFLPQRSADDEGEGTQGGRKIEPTKDIVAFFAYIAEFWRRWHISLTTGFRDYLYIPLGGSRVGKWKVVRNTFIIFLVSGLWHGANWTFIAWGFYHACLFLPLILLGRNRKYTDTVAAGRELQSIILCGVRDVCDHRIVLSNQDIVTGGSAFNIKAMSLRLGNFSKEEIHELYMQHTEATGQKFDESCFPMIWEATEDQPWLVSRKIMVWGM